MKDIHGLQIYILKEIESRFPRRADAVDRMVNLLHLQKDGIYRRIRGETILTPDEIEILVKAFKLSLDKYIFKQSDSVVFTFNPFSHKVKNFGDYLDGIHQDLMVLSQLPKVHISDAWAEIPFFYYIFYPELLSFKFYVWGRTIWQFDYLQNLKFDIDIIPTPVIQQAQQVLETYCAIPSTQLWSLNIIDNTLNQIEYFSNAGGFNNPQDAILLCNRLMQLTDHMELMATHGKKMALNNPLESGGAPLKLYHNEMIYTNNTIFVESAVGRYIYTTFGNPNFLKTSDDRMCNYTHEWFENIIAKSRLISSQGEGGRRFFFDRLRKRIDIVKKRVEMTVNGNDEGL